MPADAVLVQSHDLQIDESLLTGESVPVTPCAGRDHLARSCATHDQRTGEHIWQIIATRTVEIAFDSAASSWRLLSFQTGRLISLMVLRFNLHSCLERSPLEA